MPTTAKPFPTRRRTQAAFETIYPELLSRVTVLARRLPDPDEAAGEMLAFAWANFASVARRGGVFLPPSMLVWMSGVRYRSGRLLTGTTVTDVHSPAAQVRGRAQLIHLSLLSSSRRQQVLSDSTVVHITDALTTSERERPDVRAATRIDWNSFMRTLPRRLRRIVRGLVVGDSKGLIARRLGISNGRLSQLLDVLAREIKAFFGAEIVPAGCIA
ncbi:MAG: hypothetical protein NTW87_00900 [Planctomycetota bacterium]|nr:hypothetical protein [Planctomycetota bacterium]